MGDLKTLEVVAALSLASDNIKNLVDQLGTLSVVTLCLIVTRTILAENKVVGAEERSERSSADRVHGTGLQVHENGTWNKLIVGSLLFC